MSWFSTTPVKVLTRAGAWSSVRLTARFITPLIIFLTLAASGWFVWIQWQQSRELEQYDKHLSSELYQLRKLNELKKIYKDSFDALPIQSTSNSEVRINWMDELDVLLTDARIINSSYTFREPVSLHDEYSTVYPSVNISEHPLNLRVTVHHGVQLVNLLNDILNLAGGWVENRGCRVQRLIDNIEARCLFSWYHLYPGAGLPDTVAGTSQWGGS